MSKRKRSKKNNGHTSTRNNTVTTTLTTTTSNDVKDTTMLTIKLPLTNVLCTIELSSVKKEVSYGYALVAANEDGTDTVEYKLINTIQYDTWSDDKFAIIDHIVTAIAKSYGWTTELYAQVHAYVVAQIASYTKVSV